MTNETEEWIREFDEYIRVRTELEEGDPSETNKRKHFKFTMLVVCF